MGFQIFPEEDYEAIWGQVEQARLRNGAWAMLAAVVSATALLLVVRVLRSHNQPVTAVFATMMVLSILVALAYGALVVLWRGRSARRYRKRLRGMYFPLDDGRNADLVQAKFDPRLSEWSIVPANETSERVAFVSVDLIRIAKGVYRVESGCDFRIVTDWGIMALAAILRR